MAISKDLSYGFSHLVGFLHPRNCFNRFLALELLFFFIGLWLLRPFLPFLSIAA